MLTAYEVANLVAQPFLPALRGKARATVARLVARTGTTRPQILDVGGRRSPHTIGLDADVTVLDLPRRNEVQESLHLGVDNVILRDLKKRRSNVHRVVLEDMTKSTLPNESFDGIVCVEVIEHVPDDATFVAELARVLKPGGFLFLTTPNGDYVRNEPPNYNPDHLRHYRRDDLANLLSRHFGEVQVRYGIRTGRHRMRGLRSLTAKRPLRSLGAIVSNVLSAIESRHMDDEPKRRAHLFAEAWKR